MNSPVSVVEHPLVDKENYSVQNFTYVQALAESNDQKIEKPL